MKNIIIILVVSFLLFSFKNIYEEDEISRVTYKIGRVISTEPNPNLKSEEVKNYLNKMSQVFEQMEFDLYFNKNASIFNIVDKLYDVDDLVLKSSLNRVKGIYYRDNIKKEKIKKIDFANGFFNIVLPYDEYKWEITNESKIISGYKCYKAICVYEEYDIRRKKKLVFNPEVWFAPEIPYNYGPRGLDGLPGLVLEGKFSNGLYFYASKINLSLKDSNVKIKRPNEGKFMTNDEFQELQLEMINNN